MNKIILALIFSLSPLARAGDVVPWSQGPSSSGPSSPPCWDPLGGCSDLDSDSTEFKLPEPASAVAKDAFQIPQCEVDNVPSLSLDSKQLSTTLTPCIQALAQDYQTTIGALIRDGHLVFWIPWQGATPWERRSDLIRNLKYGLEMRKHKLFGIDVVIQEKAEIQHALKAALQNMRDDENLPSVTVTFWAGPNEVRRAIKHTTEWAGQKPAHIEYFTIQHTAFNGVILSAKARFLQGLLHNPNVLWAAFNVP